MTREEFSILVKGMKAVYSDPKFIADKDAFDVWYAMLNDLEYSQVSNACKMFMMTSKFPPTIADLRTGVVKQTQPQELTPTEAWALAYKAICNSAYHADEEYEKLPPMVKRAVGSPDNLRTWATSSDFNESVEQSQFIKIYNTECKRAEEDAKLPQSIKSLIGGNNGVIGITDRRDS